MTNEDSELEEFAPGLIIFITLIGGFLRILLLDSKGMWLDETFSLWLADQAVPDMLQWIVRIDQHPPLYYLLLHYWIVLSGDMPYYARLLSTLFGVGTIPIVYLIGKRMSGAVMGLTAAMFLALSPFNIYFAQQTRMYTLLTFNAAVAIYALVRLLTDPRSVRPIGSQFRDALHAWRTLGPVEPDREPKGEFSYRDMTRNQSGWRAWISRQRWLPIQTIETDLAWVALIVFSAATLLTHNTAVLFLLAINIFVLGLILFQRIQKPASPPAFQAPSLGNWVKAQIGIFLLWSPWLSAFIQQASRVYQEFWVPKPTWDIVTQVLISFVNGYRPRDPSQVKMIWIVSLVVLCLGLVHYRKNISRFLFLVALFAIPFLGELIVSIRRPIFLDRTLVWITIPMFLALAAGIAQLRFRFLIITAVLVLGANSLFSAGDYYRFWKTPEDWNTAARCVAGGVEKNDLILFNATWVQIPFDYYFVPYEEGYYFQVEKHGVPVDMFDSGILEPKMTKSDIPRLNSLLDGHNRVWLVYSHNWYTDPLGLIPQALAAQKKLSRQCNFYGGLVQLYRDP